MTNSEYCDFFFCNMPAGHTGDHNPHYDRSRSIANGAANSTHGQTAVGARCVNDRPLPAYVHEWMAGDQRDILRLREELEMVSRERDELRRALGLASVSAVPTNKEQQK